MESVEGTGQTVDEAIENALDELDLERDEVEITVLSEGGAEGGDGPARVLVTARDDLEYVDDVEDEDGDGDGDGAVDEQPRGRVEAPVGVAAAGADVRVVSEDARELAELAADLLEEMLDYMDLPSEVDIDGAEIEEGSGASSSDQGRERGQGGAGEPAAPSSGRGGPLPSIQLSIHGEFGGILIGRHGETLGAIQFLLGLITSRRAGRRVRVTVDVEGYRERRAKLLRDMAMRAADRAQRYRQPIFMDPMLPNERRIVHMTLQDHPGVSTHSIGEGDSRRVVVSPREAQRFGGYGAP